MVAKDLRAGELRRRLMGHAIRTVRKERGITQPELAKRIGKGVQQVHRYESGKAEVPMTVLESIADVLQYSVSNFVRDVDYDVQVRSGGQTIHVEAKSSPTKHSDVRELAVREGYRIYPQPPTKRLPPRAYEQVYEYLQKLEHVGLSAEEIEEAERFLVDGAYNKLNAREPGTKSEEDLLLDIKAAWQFVRDVLRRSGKKV